MQFQSTRDPNTIVSSSEAILRGLAPDGGLFVPTAFPKAELEDWKSLSYPELAQKVLAGFLTDYDPAFLGETAPESDFAAMTALNVKTGCPVPASLSVLNTLPVRFNTVIEPAAIRDAALK